MFDKLFGNFEEKKEEIQEKLKNIVLETEIADGKIKIKGNAARQILEIDIAAEMLDPARKEELQDLLITATNEIIMMSTEAEAEESQKLLDDMLPAGLGGLGKLFK